MPERFCPALIIHRWDRQKLVIDNVEELAKRVKRSAAVSVDSFCGGPDDTWTPALRDPLVSLAWILHLAGAAAEVVTVAVASSFLAVIS